MAFIVIFVLIVSREPVMAVLFGRKLFKIVFYYDDKVVRRTARRLQLRGWSGWVSRYQSYSNDLALNSSAHHLVNIQIVLHKALN